MIYVNGDSFSEASTYLDNPGDCWPFRIQQSTNPVFVDAVGGGSNYRIARTSTETLLRIYPRVNHAIFAWTDQVDGRSQAEKHWKANNIFYARII